jgi:hypothetical protein
MLQPIYLTTRAQCAALLIIFRGVAIGQSMIESWSWVCTTVSQAALQTVCTTALSCTLLVKLLNQPVNAIIYTHIQPVVTHSCTNRFHLVRVPLNRHVTRAGPILVRWVHLQHRLLLRC